MKRVCKEAYNNFIKSMVDEQEGTTKKFWSYVKSLRKESSGVAPLRTTTGTVYSDTLNKTNILNNQFSSVFSQEEDNIMPELGESKVPDMPNITVTTAGSRSY